MKSIIGVDIGTTNTKAILFTTEGKVLGSANASYPHVPIRQGYDEIEPALILNAVVVVIKKILSQMDSRTSLCGISFSSAMHSLMAVDELGKPLSNIMTWADLRSADEAAKIKFTAVGNRIYELCGTPIHAMTPLCKIIWIKNNKPEIFESASRFIGIKEYIWHCFFEKYQIDYSLASSMGLFNIYEFKWLEESLALAGIKEDRLSTPVLPTHIETVLSKKYKKELGLPEDIPFIIGGSDGCLANLGSQAIQPGIASLTIGTSGALRMASTKPKHDPQQRIFNYILDKDLYVSGGAMNNGGVVLDWYIKNFMTESRGTKIDYKDCLQMIETVRPGSDGLIFLPYLLGERAPIWNEKAKAVFFGIHSGHDQRYFLRAVVEGICMGLCQIGQSLEETIGQIERIYASGGFIRSKAWVQIIADMFDREIIVDDMADASAIGACILGFKALGIIKGFNEIDIEKNEQQKFLPNAKSHAVYAAHLRKFSHLYQILKEEF
jgi:gluconokinase